MNCTPSLSVCCLTTSFLGRSITGLAFAMSLQGCVVPAATPDESKPAAPVNSVGKTASKPVTGTAGSDKREVPERVASPAQQAFNSGVEAYDKGDFNNAIKRFGAPEIIAADKTIQLAALKYSAFSYCVTKRQTLCTQQFVKALKLDPSFELAAGEKGHPLWAQAFERAKKTR